MSLRSRVAAVSILAPNTGSPTRRAAPRNDRHISARRWMQRTTRPSGVPESPANSEKGCGGSRVGIEYDKPGQPYPNQLSAKPQTLVTHHAPGPLVHNSNKPKIQLPYKFLHCLVQATGHLNLTNPLGHSPDTFHSLQTGMDS